MNQHSQVIGTSLELRDLRLFVAVAEVGGFRKASKFLGLGQSAVSRRIQRLEDELGVSLFERHPGGARLTVAGRRFLDDVRAVLADLDAAIIVAGHAGIGGSGHLSIGLIASLSCGALRDVVAGFTASHPAIRMRFVETERGELLTLLNHRRLDVVVASGEFAEVHGDSVLLTREQIYVALPHNHPLCEKNWLSWGDVRNERFLVSAAEPGPEIHDYIVKRVAELGWRPDVVRHGVGREGIMNLVGLGFGISLTAEHWCGVAYPNVVFRPIGDADDLLPFSVAWLADNDNPALRRFLNFARRTAEKQLGRGSLSGASPSQTPGPLP